jgi:hypothetical protein
VSDSFPNGMLGQHNSDHADVLGHSDLRSAQGHTLAQFRDVP